MPSQGLQLAHRPGQRGPSRRLLLFTEATDQSGIWLVILVAAQFALAKGLNLRRIDHANSVPMLVQIKSQVFAVWTSSFQAGVNLRSLLFFSPNQKHPKTLLAAGGTAL